ncbi:hypothetical protein EUZ85_20940 [Hahella sp. KA22]|nr:hypothetical protein EUZ85_20940 [Hahella sp. KA22]
MQALSLQTNRRKLFVCLINNKIMKLDVVVSRAQRQYFVSTNCVNLCMDFKSLRDCAIPFTA